MLSTSFLVSNNIIGPKNSHADITSYCGNLIVTSNNNTVNPGSVLTGGQNISIFESTLNGNSVAQLIGGLRITVTTSQGQKYITSDSASKFSSSYNGQGSFAYFTFNITSQLPPQLTTTPTITPSLTTPDPTTTQISPILTTSPTLTKTQPIIKSRPIVIPSTTPPLLNLNSNLEALVSSKTSSQNISRFSENKAIHSQPVSTIIATTPPIQESYSLLLEGYIIDNSVNPPVTRFGQINPACNLTFPVRDTSGATPTPVPVPGTGNVNLNVLTLGYFPVDSSGSSIDTTVTGHLGSPDNTLQGLENYVDSNNTVIAQSLTNGTKYHNSSTPSLNYNVFPIIRYNTPIPLSNNLVPWHNNCFNPSDPCTYRPDYMGILTRENICDWVDNKNVKQVWIWGYHYNKTEPVEGDMAMGNMIKNYWNHGTYGNISNSEQIHDMPTCNHTYVLYNYDYGRGAGEAVHDHGHAIEAEMSFMDSALWNSFVSPYGKTSPTINRCGETHLPPNANTDFDYQNTTSTLSDCLDWKPTGGGKTSLINCHTWYGNGDCIDDGGLAFYVWWMQQIPGLNNNLHYDALHPLSTLRNWWDVYGNFDNALLQKKSLN